jgi:ubiquinone/menaquinone biosynthesis C-methylase UbiE
MPELDSGPSWSDIASWYDTLIREGSGPHRLATATTLQLVPQLSGQRILDVACGQGLATRALLTAGAHSVIGIDASAGMIKMAEQREAEEPLGIRYLVDDTQSLTQIADSSVHGVTCQLGLMDIPDLRTEPII